VDATADDSSIAGVGVPISLSVIQTRDADPETAAAEVKAEALIKSTGHMYRQEYVFFLRATRGKIAHRREYFDPVRPAKALEAPIVGLSN
jgi:ketosteroid isomerase-like protein